MTHTVISSHAAAHGHESPRHGVDAPTVGEFWNEPVLTVENRGRTVSILFNEPGESSIFTGPAVVIDPWGDLNVRIEGEDLYAFRELLNELPESAFVRPADPVEVPEFADGDRFKAVQFDIIYTRAGGQWQTSGTDADTTWRGTDKQIADLLKFGNAAKIDKAAWVEGDKVVNIEETGHAWLYIRNADGTWKPIGFGRGKDGRPSRDGRAIVTDFEIDRYLTNPHYDGFNVLRQGGVEL